MGPEDFDGMDMSIPVCSNLSLVRCTYSIIVNQWRSQYRRLWHVDLQRVHRRGVHNLRCLRGSSSEVFEVTDDTCFIKSDARIDGGFDRNDAKSGLKKEVLDTFSDDILDAADACPVDVIIVLAIRKRKNPTLPRKKI